MRIIEKGMDRIRIYFHKLCHRSALNASYPCIRWEKHIRIEIKPKGKINIGKRSWIRRNVELWCAKDAIIDIGNNVFLNTGTIISARKRIKIANNTIIGPNVMIYDHDHDYRGSLRGFIEGEIEIGSHVWIGANACILKNVVIGDHCVIGAGTVVTKSIPPYSIAYGQKDLIIRKMEGTTYDS